MKKAIYKLAKKVKKEVAIKCGVLSESDKGYIDDIGEWVSSLSVNPDTPPPPPPPPEPD
jgi:hypothetical protein